MDKKGENNWEKNPKNCPNESTTLVIADNNAERLKSVGLGHFKFSRLKNVDFEELFWIIFQLEFYFQKEFRRNLLASSKLKTSKELPSI